MLLLSRSLHVSVFKAGKGHTLCSKARVANALLQASGAMQLLLSRDTDPRSARVSRCTGASAHTSPQPCLCECLGAIDSHSYGHMACRATICTITNPAVTASHHVYGAAVALDTGAACGSCISAGDVCHSARVANILTLAPWLYVVVCDCAGPHPSPHTCLQDCGEDRGGE